MPVMVSTWQKWGHHQCTVWLQSLRLSWVWLWTTLCFLHIVIIPRTTRCLRCLVRAVQGGLLHLCWQLQCYGGSQTTFALIAFPLALLLDWLAMGIPKHIELFSNLKLLVNMWRFLMNTAWTMPIRGWEQLSWSSWRPGSLVDVATEGFTTTKPWRCSTTTAMEMTDKTLTQCGTGYCSTTRAKMIHESHHTHCPQGVNSWCFHQRHLSEMRNLHLTLNMSSMHWTMMSLKQW